MICATAVKYATVQSDAGWRESVNFLIANNLDLFTKKV